MRGGLGRSMTVSALFGRLGGLFVEGRLREMTAFWSFPCPIEMDGRLVVMRDPPELEDFFATRRAKAMEVGLTAFEPRISAIEMPRQGRFRVWMRWAHTFGNVCLLDENGSVYYLSRRPMGDLTIEMMDIVILPREAVLAATG